MRQACVDVTLRRFANDRLTRIVASERARDRAPAPGATQIQPVEMRDLSIRAIRDDRRLEQRTRLTLCDVRQKRIEPRAPLVDAERATHALRFHQCGRNEVVAPRLPRLARAVAPEPVAR